MDDGLVRAAEDEVDEQDVLQLWGRLQLTPEQRLRYLLGMLEWEHIARRARRVG